jgi:hypothetical protein
MKRVTSKNDGERPLEVCAPDGHYDEADRASRDELVQIDCAPLEASVAHPSPASHRPRRPSPVTAIAIVARERAHPTVSRDHDTDAF